MLTIFLARIRFYPEFDDQRLLAAVVRDYASAAAGLCGPAPAESFPRIALQS
jgi:hypothetical protein